MTFLLALLLLVLFLHSGGLDLLVGVLTLLFTAAPWALFALLVYTFLKFA